jgi:hypothetical protein
MVQCRGMLPPHRPLLREVGVRRETVLQAAALLCNQRGQGLIEMGIIVSLFLLLSMGIIEFGRIFMLSNMVMHAARDGGRAAAIIGASYRNADGTFPDGGAAVSSAVHEQLRGELQGVLDPFDVRVVQLDSGTIPVVQVTLNGQLHYIFNLVGNTVEISRTVTFRDEGRSAP